MNKTVEQIMQKSKAADELTKTEIITLMDHVIDLLDDFEKLTQDSIDYMETFHRGFLDRDRWAPGLL